MVGTRSRNLIPAAVSPASKAILPRSKRASVFVASIASSRFGTALGEGSREPKQQISCLVFFPELRVDIGELSLDSWIIGIALQHLFEDAGSTVVVVFLLGGVREN